MARLQDTTQTQRGVALLTALGLLFIFSLLGIAYLGYATTELDTSNFGVRQLRARYMARGGVEAAIGEIESALAAGRTEALLDAPLEVAFPVYGMNRQEPEGFAAQAQRKGMAQVSIADESGKINLNHAPTRVLQAILGVDGDTARRIRNSLPGADSTQPGGSGQSWLASVDELVTRGFLTPAAFEALPKNALTVYTVSNHASPVAYLNVNAAPPEVLAAVLDISREAAKEVIKKRPFLTLADLGAAAGKDPLTFNYRPAPDAPTALPEALCLQSRCFRITSQARLADVTPTGQESRATRGQVEAVAVFENRTPRITYWSEARGF